MSPGRIRDRVVDRAAATLGGGGMTIGLWLGFVGATFVISLVPGPSMLLVIGHAAGS